MCYPFILCMGVISDHPSKYQVSFHHQSILDGNSCYKQLLGTKKVSLGRGGRKTCLSMYRGGSYHLLSLLVFCYCFCTCPCCCRSFNLSLCCLSPFHLSCITLLRQCTCSLSESTLIVPQFSSVFVDVKQRKDMNQIKEFVCLQ